MNYVRSRLITILEINFKNYSQFIDTDYKEDLVVNFHARKYMEPATNQRIVKPHRLRIPADILYMMEKQSSLEERRVITALKKFIGNFQSEVECNEYIFSNDVISRYLINQK